MNWDFNPLTSATDIICQFFLTFWVKWPFNAVTLKTTLCVCGLFSLLFGCKCFTKNKHKVSNDFWNCAKFQNRSTLSFWTNTRSVGTEAEFWILAVIWFKVFHQVWNLFNSWQLFYNEKEPTELNITHDHLMTFNPKESQHWKLSCFIMSTCFNELTGFEEDSCRIKTRQ